ncbi:hypothetical protein PCANC_17128 [Puccinia coronata f. sp. avenae]|uniref:Uncharacterized protein n=1 Tax=Puccinia coronata f. sp. avenae TaxID=200324 RepID=A0A2N5U1C0_9BASI|nr:hypothetical protein PCANC_17128 [Puccinia coronata f. sp. avenae]
MRPESLLSLWLISIPVRSHLLPKNVARKSGAPLRVREILNETPKVEIESKHETFTTGMKNIRLEDKEVESQSQAGELTSSISHHQMSNLDQLSYLDTSEFKNERKIKYLENDAKVLSGIHNEIMHKQED